MKNHVNMREKRQNTTRKDAKRSLLDFGEVELSPKPRLGLLELFLCWLLRLLLREPRHVESEVELQVETTKETAEATELKITVVRMPKNS